MTQPFGERPPPDERPSARIIEMTLDGRFVDEEPPRLGLGNQLAAWGLMLGAMAAGGAMLVLMLWLAAALVPILLAAGFSLYLFLRLRLWLAQAGEER